IKRCGQRNRTHACLCGRAAPVCVHRTGRRRQVHSLVGENVEKNISRVGMRRMALEKLQAMA
ncbi:MAG: hypothetical protein DRG35_05250, partial [Deltaproteobacteria bacterium]